MPIPLFPNPGTPITIKQGRVGDCYLLAALDCILNTAEGYRHFKSMFQETDYGVNVRIRRNAHSRHLISRLDQNILALKYIHIYDQKTNEDVFTVNPLYIQEIEKREEGVKSNSLAVLIIERLSAYYLNTATPKEDSANESGEGRNALGFDSLFEHNKSGRFNSSDVNFFEDLFGIRTVGFNSDTLYYLAYFKKKMPNAPVYISLNYGKVDRYNQKHTRHALRVKSVEEHLMGDKLVLVNPWETTSTETWNLEEIAKRQPFFCVFYTSPEVQKQLDTVLALPETVIHGVNCLSPIRKNTVQDTQRDRFNGLVSQAIRERVSVYGEHTETLVRQGLALYYLSNLSTRYITSAAGLRQFFEDNPNRSNLIAENLRPGELALGAIELYRAGHVPFLARDYLKQAKPQWLNIDFLQKMLAINKFKDPSELIIHIFLIAQDNKEFAKALLFLVKDNLPSLFQPQISFYELSINILTSNDRQLTSWFSDLTSTTQHIPGAQDLALFIWQLQHAIESFKVVFSMDTSEEDIEAERKHLCSQLDEIVSDFSQRPGFSYAFSINAINKVYSKKVASIFSAAQKQKTLLVDDSIEVISRYLSRIRLFSCLFTDTQTIEKIEERKRELMNNLTAIRTMPELSDALQRCNNQGHLHAIDTAFQNKRQHIENVASFEVHLKRINYQGFIQKLDSLIIPLGREGLSLRIPQIIQLFKLQTQTAMGLYNVNKDLKRFINSFNANKRALLENIRASGIDNQKLNEVVRCISDFSVLLAGNEYSSCSTAVFFHTPNAGGRAAITNSALTKAPQYK